MNRGELVSRERRAIWLLILLLLFAVALGLGLWIARGAGGPPIPVISPIGLPKDVTHQRSARFMFSAARPVTFQCALDERPFTNCGAKVVGSKSYPGPLPWGQHTFKVRAALGHRTSPAATYSWFILRSSGQTPAPAPGQPSGSPGGGPSSSGGGGTSSSGSGGSTGGSSTGGSSGGGASGGSSGGGTSGGGTPPPAGPGQPPPPPPPPPPPTEPGGMPFGISGSVSGLVPGATKVIALRLANPNSVPIHVTRVTVSVSADSSPPGCSSAANLVLYQATGITSAAPVAVPARGSVTVTTFPRAPKIGFRNLHSNQDACKKTTFRLIYTGSAHS